MKLSTSILAILCLTGFIGATEKGLSNYQYASIESTNPLACENCKKIHKAISKAYTDKVHCYYSQDNGNYEFVRSHCDWCQILAYQDMLEIVEEIIQSDKIQ